MPLKLLIDEDTRHNSLWTALLAHNETATNERLEVLRIGDDGAPACGTLDQEVLRWAIAENRLIVSHDVNTLIGHHDELVKDGQTTPGLLIVRKGASIPALIESFILFSHCCDPSDLSCKCTWIPLDPVG